MYKRQHLLRDDGSETEVSASELKKGDVVIVRINELIPNDGEVIEGIDVYKRQILHQLYQSGRQSGNS